MENFTNEVIDTAQLPKFETVTLTKLDPNYGKVVGIAIFITFLVLGAGLGMLLYFNPLLLIFLTELLVVFGIFFALLLFFSAISVRKKAYAFRAHDVIFQKGILATNTIIIPYNRIQHVALHEGFVARFFGLARIEIFTAGGSSSDIAIPGIALDQAEDIKQLLMGKIQKKL